MTLKGLHTALHSFKATRTGVENMPAEQAVHTDVVQISYVNDPKKGKKWGSIKSASGDYYWGPPSALDPFRNQVGRIVDVSWIQSGEFKQLVTMAAKRPPTAQQQQAMPGVAGGQSPSQAPQKPAGGNNQTVGVRALGNAEEATARRIFVCGVVQQAMSSGKFAAEDILPLTIAADRAYNQMGKEEEGGYLLDQLRRNNSTPQPSVGPRDDVPTPESENDYGN